MCVHVRAHVALLPGMCPRPASPPGAGTPGAGAEPGAVSAGRFDCSSSLCCRERPGGKATRISAGRHLSPSSQGLWASPPRSSSVPALPGSVRSVLGSGPLGRRTQQQSWLICIFLKNKFTYLFLFLAVLGLRCCVWAFSSCGERRLLFVAVRGLLIVVASFAAEHGL